MDFLQEKADRYVIYARKSSEEKERQAASIPDQIYFCKKLEEKDGLTVVNVIEESKSAKMSGQRPKFLKMIKDIKAGKIDGIIAWHPDRLARNMFEGGEIIDLLDSGQLVDLRFCTQQFSKDDTGKMLLGISFVFSKHYSDNLSTHVKKANIRKHEEGHPLGRTKFGYDIKKERYAKGKFWRLIQQAWQKRLAGEKEPRIADWLNKRGFYRELISGKKARKKQYMTSQKINKMFKDKIYCGILNLKGDSEVDLREKYNFPAMITEEEYWEAQRMERSGGQYIKVDKPLRGKIFDAIVPNIEYKPQIINNGKVKYLRYVVDNAHKKKVAVPTKSQLKAIQAKDIVEALDRKFKHISPKFTEEKYREYIKAARKHSEDEFERREQEKKRIRGSRTKAKNDLTNLEENHLLYRKEYDTSQRKIYRRKKTELTNEIKNYNKDLSKMEKEETKFIPDFKKFLNMLKSLSTSYKTFSGDKKLEIAEMAVLNIFAHGGKVLEIELNEPFNSLFLAKILNGSGGGIRTPE